MNFAQFVTEITKIKNDPSAKSVIKGKGSVIAAQCEIPLRRFYDITNFRIQDMSANIKVLNVIKRFLQEQKEITEEPLTQMSSTSN